jgi:hypothetical protein
MEMVDMLDTLNTQNLPDLLDTEPGTNMAGTADIVGIADMADYIA